MMGKSKSINVGVVVIAVIDGVGFLGSHCFGATAKLPPAPPGTYYVLYVCVSLRIRTRYQYTTSIIQQ